MPFWPFRQSAVDAEAARLLAAAMAASRNSALFGEGRVSDTLEGRFELAALHAALVLIRLRNEPAQAALAQAFTDKLFRWLDAGLREDGVGDLSVPKRMRAMAGAFYGRLEAYDRALEADDAVALAAALGRNVLGEEGHAFAQSLARYTQKSLAALRASPAAGLGAADAWAAATD